MLPSRMHETDDSLSPSLLSLQPILSPPPPPPPPSCSCTRTRTRVNTAWRVSRLPFSSSVSSTFSLRRSPRPRGRKEGGVKKYGREGFPAAVLESTRHSASRQGRPAIRVEDYLICYVLPTNRKHLAVERDGAGRRDSREILSLW